MISKVDVLNLVRGIGVIIVGFGFVMIMDNLIPGGSGEERATMLVVYAILYLAARVVVGLDQISLYLKKSQAQKVPLSKEKIDG